MRTKNRPLLLKRAIESVVNQTYKNYILVVVNDGGDCVLVDNLIAEFSTEINRYIVIHNEQSLGMEAASNLGISSSKSKYIVIHDDDDSWQNTFLEETVGFLESSEGCRYSGVVTHAVKIMEKINENGYETMSSSSYNSYLNVVLLADILARNHFPPISFLYYRSTCESISGYDDTLPVLGDWEFNLRFVLKSDIAVIRKKLANYHHRISVDDKSSYKNTVTGLVDKHVEYDCLIRNRYLRKDIEASQVGLGFMLALGKYHNDIEDQQKVVPNFIRKILYKTWYGKMLKKLLFNKIEY